MRLRTFTAPDMPAAMEMARAALGEDAIILATHPQNGRRSVSITAAIGQEESGEWQVASDKKKEKPILPSLTTNHSPLGTDSLRFDLQTILRFHNLPELFCAKLMQKASSQELASFTALHKIGGTRDAYQLNLLSLEKLLDGFFDFAPLPLEEHSPRLMLVGAPGIGKTLTIAKLAAKFTLSSKGRRPLTVITTDNKRAGGIEQLKAFTDILALPLKIAQSPEHLRQELSNLPEGEGVLIDTSGYNPYDAAEREELTAYAAVGGFEPVLAMQAGGDSLEAIDLVEPFAALPIRRLLLTRADTSRRFGGALAAAATYGLAFCNVSNSASITDSLPALDGALLAQLLLRYQL